MRIRMHLSAAFATLFVVLAVTPAFADDPLTFAFTEGESEAEVVEEDQGSQLGIEPAVEAPPVEEPDDARAWTQRFLAPAVLALGVLGLIGSMIYYGVRVRGKYRVAQ